MGRDIASAMRMRASCHEDVAIVLVYRQEKVIIVAIQTYAIMPWGLVQSWLKGVECVREIEKRV